MRKGHKKTKKHIANYIAARKMYPNGIPREIRICACGCNQTFECKVNLKKKFIKGHENRGRISYRKGKTYAEFYGKEKAEKLGKEHSEKLKGRRLTEEHKNNIKNALRSEKTKLKMREAYANRKFPFNDTKPELLVDKILNELGFLLNQDYEKQKYSLPGTPDRFIKPNICIFADGDYWHNLPEQIEKDKKINKVLEEQKYKVIRFWEKDLKNNFNECKEQIKRVI